jgi:hypothetical protein
MNVSNVTSATSPYPSSYQSNFRLGLQDFESLAGALQSGNLASAQTAFSSLEQDLPGISQLLQPGSSTGSAADQSSPIPKALQSLQTALKSGDLSGAQQAFANLQQGLQSARSAHRGHHHHHASATNATNSANQAAGTDSDGDSDGSSGAATGSSSPRSLLNAQA